MNSKSFDTQQVVINQVKGNKSFDFVKLYKSTAESTVVQFESNKLSKKDKKNNKNSELESDTLKSLRSPNQRKKGNGTLDLSNIESDKHGSSKTTRSSRKSNLTSTPNNKDKQLDNGVKSIMKNKFNDMDSVLNVSNISTPSTKPKKRNKSVSFMLDDIEEVAVKRSKSNGLTKEHKNREKQSKNKEKLTNPKSGKQKKHLWLKENRNLIEDITKLSNKENITNDTMLKDKVKESTLGVAHTKELVTVVKKLKKPKLEREKVAEVTDDNYTGEQNSENKSRKLKKKKRKAKSIQDDNTNVEGEPAIKTRKKDLKPEVIAKGLENLNIGDNAHTLTNLLDEMTVVDKNTKKKNKQKQKKNKLKKTMVSGDKQENTMLQQDSNTEEKPKWSNRKWNKDTKGDSRLRLQTSVLVEHLPIKIMCSYKTLLSERFSKFGTIAGIGVAEAYPNEDHKPVFTTTVFFQEEEAVTKALEEDNTKLEGNRIRVRRPQPPTETTLVVRAYGLTDQALSSLFSSAGRVRAIRQLIKGKKSMPTAFVEFDGPETVERALKLAEDAKINGKKVYVSKFEIRKKGKFTRSEKNSINGGENDSSTE